VPVEKTGPRYDSVFTVDLTNASSVPQLPYTMTLHAVRFHGKWISQAHLLMILVFFWILFAVSWPLMAAFELRRKLHNSRMHLRVMQQVHETLRAEARELADQAHLDPLTRVLNREGLQAAFAKSPRAATAPMSVIFTDIDHFKRINDTQGHGAGDAVLRQFAGLMASLVRSSDKVVRWGGEEFLIFCPHTEARHAASVAEQLRQHMLGTTWPAGLQVTASFGVAQYRAPEPLDDAIERADKALYLAKQAGRNRVVVDGDPLLAAGNDALAYRPG